MKSLSIAELDAFLNVAKKHSERDYLMFLVTFLHGLRISETLSLTAANIVDGALVIQRLKGSKKTTQTLLPSELDGLEALAKTDGLFFPICRMTAHRRIKAYAEEAGIVSYKAHMHCLKHTTAMQALDGGMKINELQTYLGHVSGKSTLMYLRVNDETASKAFAAAVGGGQ